MNINIYAGNICNDLKLQSTNNNINYCRFSIAVKRPMTEDKTDFIPCIAWRNTAEFITKYFRKGDKILLNGYMTVQSYEKDNVKRIMYEMVVAGAEFCQKAKPSMKDLKPADDDSELPF